MLQFQQNLADLMQYPLRSNLGEVKPEPIDMNVQTNCLVNFLSTKDDVLFLATSKLVMLLIEYVDTTTIA